MLGSLSTRFDQLVLSLVLVGSDLHGDAAQARRDKDLGSGAQGKKQVKLVPGWSGPAAATLGPLVECLEADGFRLVHRETLYDYEHEAGERRGGRGVAGAAEPPLHAAALTLVQNYHSAAASRHSKPPRENS